jgi:hypothetical protein
MVSLRMAFHSVTGRRVVEVFDNDGLFIATIYPDEEHNAIKIVSGYIDTVAQDDGSQSLPRVPAVSVKFRRKR